jgi:hypothetical protein
MDRACVTLREMLQDLLLNQCLTKVDISKTIKASVGAINRVLSEGTENPFRTKQIGNVSRLYGRLKLCEYKIEEYLVSLIPPYHKISRPKDEPPVF